jgi:chemotaxis protein CheZ
MSDEIKVDLAKQAFQDFLKQEMDDYVAQLMAAGFYEKLVVEMKQGLNDVYTTINDFKDTLGLVGDSTNTEDLIGDASDQLEEIVKTTESATNQIMDITERNQDVVFEAIEWIKSQPDSEKTHEMGKKFEAMNFDFMNLMTACSFQDLTGQRVKKVVDLIKKIEEQILQVMVSSGVKMKEKQAGKEVSEIESSANDAVELLKGPDSTVKQGGVDDLLASLGL